MKRRDLLLLLGGAATVWPAAASAQQSDRERALMNRILRLQAGSAALKVNEFFRDIESHLGWTVQLPVSAATINQRRFDALRVLRQAPAVTELAQLDAAGIEDLRVSRGALEVATAKRDFSQDPKFTEALAKKVYYGPFELRENNKASPPRPEPYMTLSLAGARREAGVSVAEVNLKLLWDLVSVGGRGATYILDGQNRLVAHPDISLVLGKTDMSGLAHVQAARAAGPNAASEPLRTTRDIRGRDVLTAHAWLAVPGWLVLVELPVDETDALAR